MLDPQAIRNPGIVLLLLSFLVLQGCDPYGDTEILFNGNIEGTVYDLSTNQPVVNASIFYDRIWDYYYFDVNSYLTFYNNHDAVSDVNGNYLVRNLLEKTDYNLVVTKWPGYNQKVTRVTPVGKETQQKDIYLEPADAKFSVDPLSLHFESGQDFKSLVITNEGNSSFSWDMDIQEPWLYCYPTRGILTPKSTISLEILIDREIIVPGSPENSISITVLSTGETQTVNITVEL